MDNTKDKGIKGKKVENEHLHDGHRDRVRDRFMFQEDFTTFTDHEALEMLLFSAIQRKDTNALAHRLIQHFGSLPNVLDASVADLCTVPQMTRNAAILIKEILPLARRYLLARGMEKAVFNSIRSVAKRFSPFFQSQQREVVYALFLNINGELLQGIELGRGTPTSTEFDTERLVQIARSSNAVRVILMHNHPSNNVHPSENDIMSTNNAMIQLVFNNIALWDHIIFGADNRFFSFYQNNIIHMMMARCNRVLHLNISDLYLKMRVPEKFSKFGVKLSEAEFEAIAESMDTGTADDAYPFVRNIMDYCHENGFIVSADDENEYSYI